MGFYAHLNLRGSQRLQALIWQWLWTLSKCILLVLTPRARYRCWQDTQHDLAKHVCSPESPSYPGLHQKQHDQQVKGRDSTPLLCACETPHLQYCVQFWGLQHKKDMDLLEWVKRTVTMIRGVGHLSYEDRLKQLRLLSLENRKVWGDLTVPSSTLREMKNFLQGQILIDKWKLF